MSAYGGRARRAVGAAVKASRRLSILLLLPLLTGCSHGAQPNILFLLVDTLRADRLGVYGSQRGLTPFLDTLAERGVVFRNAYAQSSWTDPSIASLFTSRYQSQHQVISFGSVLREEEVTFTEVLRQHGYATAAFSANFLLAAKNGFAQGFDHFQTFAAPATDAQGRPTFGKERAARIDREALTWLDQRARGDSAPVFLYLHYMEPHNPYAPEPQFLQHVLGARARPDQAAVNTRMTMPNVGVFSDEMAQGVTDYYDAEVMSLDAALRQLFTDLESRGVLERTVVVIAADHGEELRDHGLMGHGQTLFEEVIRVPLIMLIPGQTTRVDVATPVSLVDVGPTLLDLAGIAAPPSFEGHSLRPFMGLPARWSGAGESQPSGTPVAYSELIKDDLERLVPHERAVVTASSKLIAGTDGEREFYNLAADPHETNASALGEEARAFLSGSLARFAAHVTQPAAPAATLQLDPETRERMRALGYHQ
jgi:arylsulfatase A-like enzyme